jgi:hypothetical protein
MFITYEIKNFNTKSLDLIAVANQIIDEYQAQGYDLTLRQLYYQLVARNYIPNAQKEYKKLVALISNARLGGLISWTAIVDRTRGLAEISTWGSPQSILKSAYESYRRDLWAGQDYRIEVWIEKDALRGVISSICDRLDVPNFSCRGYNSQSEMWAAAQRLREWMKVDILPVIIHLGDHDPSGIDMTRDIIDRLELFTDRIAGQDFEVIRVALNIDQIEQYNPPPYWAKLTDSRSNGYIAQYGRDSWELDALSPSVLDQIISDTVAQYRNDDLFEQRRQRQEKERSQLKKIADQYSKIITGLNQ